LMLRGVDVGGVEGFKGTPVHPRWVRKRISPRETSEENPGGGENKNKKKKKYLVKAEQKKKKPTDGRKKKH